MKRLTTRPVEPTTAVDVIFGMLYYVQSSGFVVDYEDGSVDCTCSCEEKWNDEKEIV